MSNFLAVDTSSRYLTVVAKNGESVAVTHLPDCAMAHSVLLMDEVEKTLDEVGLDTGDCDYFVAVTGPGSFTGIRIGIACVKGFAAALNKRAAGVTVFEMISYNVNSDRDYLVAVDAAHGYYYVCGYSADGSENLAPAYLSEERLRALGRPVYGFGELGIEDYTRVDIKDCLLPAAERCADGRENLTALYVRKSQAEEERLARKGGAL